MTSARAYKADEPLDHEITRWIQDAFVRTENSQEFRRRLEQMCIMLAVNKGHYYVVREGGASYGLPMILGIGKEQIRKHLVEIEPDTGNPHAALERLHFIHSWVDQAKRVFKYDYPSPDAANAIRVDGNVKHQDLAEQLELDISAEIGVWFSIASLHLRILDNVASMASPAEAYSAHNNPAARVGNKRSSFWNHLQNSRQRFRYDPHYALYHMRWIQGTWPPFIQPARAVERRQDHDRGTIYELRKISQAREETLRQAEASAMPEHQLAPPSLAVSDAHPH